MYHSFPFILKLKRLASLTVPKAQLMFSKLIILLCYSFIMFNSRPLRIYRLMVAWCIFISEAYMFKADISVHGGIDCIRFIGFHRGVHDIGDTVD